MQITQLFRRGIVAPLTDQTADQLATWFVDGLVSIDFLPISNDAMFYKLWDTGIFQSLNQKCGTIIDDYEEEALKPDNMEIAMSVLIEFKQTIKDPDVNLFVENLITLCRSAQKNNHPVYFVF
jgi:hypothetical protein